jgi:dTDP-4-dehydrorhamnose 3,5-epimerase
MKVTATTLEGVTVIEPQVFADARGNFYESFNHQRFAELVEKVPFVQDNPSFSKKGVVRGLHYQLPPSEHTECTIQHGFWVKNKLRPEKKRPI